MNEQYEVIVDWVKEGSTVIDLGCGDGELLMSLKIEKNVEGLGVEHSPDCIKICEKLKTKVIYGEIDEISSLKSNGWDYAICNVTLQMVQHPMVLLKEMARISKYQIISFPNFAKWQNRLELMFKGRMPRWMLCGYNWYDTGHIHQLSLKDFELYAKGKIIKRHIRKPFPNLLTHTAIYLCEL